MPRLRALAFSVVCGCVMGLIIAPARAQEPPKPDSSKQDTASHDTSKKSPPTVSPEKAPTDSSADKNTQGYANEPLVYEKVRGVIRYEEDGTGTKETFARIRVQSSTGVQRAAQATFYYTAANETLQVKSAKVIKPDGTVIASGPEDVVDTNAPLVQSAPMYTDVREKHLTMPGLAAGDVVEYDLVERIVTPFTPGQFWNYWNFITDAVALDEELTLDAPADRKLKIKSPEGMEPTETEQAGRRMYVWKTKNEKAEIPLFRPRTKFDPAAILAGSSVKPGRMMLFSTFQSWDEMGKWYAQIAEDREQATPEVAKTANTITGGLRTQTEKAEAIYDYVARIRYVSLSFGLGRYQPHTAAEVMTNRYGDCKDKATLMDALLKSQGIDSKSALIPTRLPLDPNMPSPEQFDHMINVIHADGQEIWLDSTIGVGPFGYLLPPLRGKQALVMSEKGESKLETTTEKNTSSKTYSFSVEALDEAGTKGRVKLELQGGGDLEVLLRLGLMHVTPAQVVELIRSGQGNQGGGSWSDVTSSDAFDLKKPLRLEGTFTANDGAGPAGMDKDTPKLMVLANWTEMVQKILPAWPSKAMRDAETVELEGPEEFILHVRLLKEKEGAPLSVPNVEQKTDFGEYSLKAEEDEKFVTVDQHLTLKAPEVRAENKVEYVHFRSEVLGGEASILLAPPSRVATKASKETAAGAEGRKNSAGDDSEIPKPAITSTDDHRQPLFEAAIRADRNNDYAAGTELLRQAVAADPTYGLAWYALGWNYNYLHDYVKAEAALRKAIELTPDIKREHGNLGVALKGQKRYSEAIPEYKREIELSPTLDWPHQGLGWMYYMTGQWKDAVSELETAAKLSPNNPGIQFDLARAYAKNGQGDKAVQAYERSVEIRPTASRQNDVAYEMAVDNLNLDQARKYSLAAIASVEGQIRDVSLDNLSTQDTRSPGTLASYFDTLGWVDFQRGDLKSAEKYVAAAWQLENKGDLGSHLGQIYEKEGRKQDAIEAYAEGVLAAPKDQEVRDKLEALVGAANVDSTAEHARQAWTQERELKVKNPRDLDGMAEFWVELGRGKSGTGDVEIQGTKFVMGDDGLKDADGEIKTAKFGNLFVDDGDYKILKKVRLECRKGEDCKLEIEQGGKGK